VYVVEFSEKKLKIQVRGRRPAEDDAVTEALNIPLCGHQNIKESEYL